MNITNMIDCRKIRARGGVDSQGAVWLAVLAQAVTIFTAGQAQTLTTLANFGGPSTNLAGFFPDAALIQGSDGTLYGTTFNGQFPAAGTVFKMQPDGSGFRVLKFFTNWLEGKFVYARLTLSSNVLYGTADTGGDSDLGTIFRIGTDGSGFQALKSLGTNDGANPVGGLVLSDNVLYGTVVNYPGASGAVFRINTDGTDYTLLKILAPNDGVGPLGDLTLSDGVLYGTTQAGGNSGYGTVFRVNTDGTDFTVLKHFAWAEGARLQSGLTLSGGVLYGAGFEGGGSYGTVFKLNTNGTGFAVLKYFTYSEGQLPIASPILVGGALYGTTAWGSISNMGTVYQINTDGTGFKVLKSFTGPDGGVPHGGLLYSGGVLYGTTEQGGAFGKGTVFKIELSAPALTIQSTGNSFVLNWSNPAFALQAAPTATGVYMKIPGATSPYTNAIEGGQQFFRLIGN